MYTKPVPLAHCALRFTSITIIKTNCRVLKRHLISSFAGHSTLPTETGFKYSYLAIRNNQFRKDKNTNKTKTCTSAYCSYLAHSHCIRIKTQNVLFVIAYIASIVVILRMAQIYSQSIQNTYRKGCRNVLMILSQGYNPILHLLRKHNTREGKRNLEATAISNYTRYRAPHYKKYRDI